MFDAALIVSADHELNVSLQNFMQWEGQISSDRTEFK